METSSKAVLQFQKVSKKRKLLNAGADTVDDAAHLPFDTSKNGEETKGPLVIPLPKPRAQPPQNQITNGEKIETKRTRVKEDKYEAAAAELIRDLHEKTDDGIESGDKNELVIGQVHSGNGNGNGDNGNLDNGKALPILQASIAPELLTLKDEGERFKVDLALRPDDMNIRSDRYRDTPVEEFGAAMLRGMGWAGPSKEDEEYSKSLNEKILSREHRLGLGALAKPPGSDGRGGKDKIKRNENEWQKKATEKLSKQKIEESDIVWLRDPKFVGRRAKVIQVSGVPGLDKIRVRLEHDGTVEDIRRTDAILVSNAELEDAPFTDVVAEQSQMKPQGETAKGSKNELHEKAEQNNGVKSVGTSHRHTKRSHDDRKEDGISMKSHKKSEYDHAGSAKSSSRHGTNMEKEKSWLRAGIRIKIVTKKFGSAYYLQKGVIQDITTPGVASVRLDSGALVESVRQKYLETCLPPIGGPCVVLVGRHTGQTATLLERLREAEKALIQMTDELDVVEVSMDHIAAYLQT